MKIDLRSDTVTLPTPEMMKAIQSAPLGDDVFGEDPTINALQEKAAQMFGMESALFCPSGTMANQIAINVHTTPGDEVICSSLSHIYLYEGGGVARNSGASVRLIPTEDGILSADQIKSEINPEFSYYARTSLVSLENTCNKGGGSTYRLKAMQDIGELCRTKGLGYHLDGARLFNAIVEEGYQPHEIGALFDSISICLSKGLGAPVGSLLLGSQDFIKEAHRARKVFGGGMRQGGLLAAAGIYALDHHVDRLREDHELARSIGEIIGRNKKVKRVMPVKTNILIFQLHQAENLTPMLLNLEKNGIFAMPFGTDKIRMVTHMDVSKSVLDHLERIVQEI